MQYVANKLQFKMFTVVTWNCNLIVTSERKVNCKICKSDAYKAWTACKPMTLEKSAPRSYRTPDSSTIPGPVLTHYLVT